MRPIRLLRSLLLASLAAASAGTAGEQAFDQDWNPRTGDAWVDTWLGDMNRYGTRYREAFIDEVVRYHATPRELATELLVDRGWAPGDVYFACTIAQVIGRPCRAVVEEWSAGHAQGWSMVAKRLGVTPGSAEFHRLKSAFVPTYERWSRPIQLDADLRRADPTHGSDPGIRATDGAASPVARPAAKDDPGKAARKD